jgi:tetratricopeptide (TPR) repeat protein
MEFSLYLVGCLSIGYYAGEGRYDVPIILRDFPAREETVFFVSGLQWGGGRGYSNAYRALNLHREYLVETKIRSVFWITQAESKQMTRHAPDFWAFRHKVVDFLDLPSRRDIVLANSRQESYGKAIERYKKILGQDPKNAPTHEKLADLLHALGCYDEAVLQYKKALRLVPGNNACLLALAQTYLDMGQDTLARRTQRKTSGALMDSKI